MVGTSLGVVPNRALENDRGELSFSRSCWLFMRMNPQLSLSEKLVLLATNIEKGNVVANAGISLNYCIAGAVLFEMIEKKLLVFENKHIVQWPHGLTGDALYDLGLEKIKHLEKEKHLKYWIEVFSSVSDHMRTLILDRLVEKGVLMKEDKVLLWVFHVDRYPEKDAKPEHELRARLANIVEEKLEPGEEDLVLLSIVKSSDLVTIVFPKHLRKTARKKIEALTHEDRFSGEIAKIVQDIETAIVTVMIAGIAVVAAT